MDSGPYGIDSERFEERLVDCVVRYLPRCCGIGPSGRGELLPPFLELKAVPLYEAKKRAIDDATQGRRPWIEETAGFHTYGFGQWQFTPRLGVSY